MNCDGIVIRAVDVQFELILRRGDADTALATWTQHWEPLPAGSFKAQPYELDVEAPAIELQPGDQLVFRYQGLNPAGTTSMAFIPNGDGALAEGRIPSITLP
ncbi:MAG: hypothetical protein WKG01_33800 [Kofleriaceae bacterium]